MVIIVVIVIAVAASHSGSGSNGGSTPASAAGKLGSKVRDGKFQFLVTRVTRIKNVGDTAQGLGDTAQGEYTVLHVTVTNIGNQAQTLDDTAQYVYDSKNRQFSASSSADIDGNGGNGGGVFLNQINPGDSVHGKLYFDLPKATRPSQHNCTTPRFRVGSRSACGPDSRRGTDRTWRQASLRQPPARRKGILA